VGFTLSQLAYAEIGARGTQVSGPSMEEILSHALEAERIDREHVRRTNRALSEREALHLVSTRFHGGLQLGVALAAKGDLDGTGRRAVWDGIVRSRALSFDTMASRGRAVLESSDAEVERLALAFRQARSGLASAAIRAAAAPKDQAAAVALRRAQAEKDAAERALAGRSRTFATEFEQARVGADEVLERLPTDTALISYWIDWDWFSAPLEKYVAFVLRPGDPAPVVVRLGSHEEVDALVAAWRKKTMVFTGEGAEAASRAAGVKLRRAIWDPVAKYLGDARRILIVPAGQLHTVSFAALPVGKDRYLVDGPAAVHYLSAERDLVGGPAAQGQGLLVLGGPSFEAQPRGELLAQTSSYRGPRSSCDNFEKMRFAPLPESAREASAVEKLSRAASAKVDLLLGPRASETAFKELAPGHRFLHVATHGFFLGGACASTLDPVTHEMKSENPLLLSGLALAGANRRAAAGADEDDGILTAEEIAALDLSSVEWAVLSACDTGSGDVESLEGVLGLQRAFRIAGARTVVMSLWPVDDRATRRFMEKLYGLRMREGADVGTAMQGAMRAVLVERRRKGLSTDPFHWAGFVATGAWTEAPGGPP